MRPDQVTPPEGWREGIALQGGCLSMARHLECWRGRLLEEWGGEEGLFHRAFQQKRPLHLEFCSGNGLWIADQAERHPEYNWIAVERRFDRVRQICSKRANRSLHNLLVVWGEAELFTPHFLADESIDQVYINFPDPWPRKKHAHKRIMRPDFIQEVIRILKVGGRLAFVTDEAPFALATRELLEVEPHLSNCFGPDLKTSWPEYGGSTFEALWRSKGLEIYYQMYQRARH